MTAPRRSFWLHPAAKPVLLVVLLLPLARLVWGAFNDGLGPNPAEALIRGTGDWTMRLLWLTLAITPLRELLKQPALARFRRMIGVTTFCYACLHLLCYAWLDMGLEPADIAKDIAKRPFILMGFTAWLLLVPLAATSFNRAIKALGARRWQVLAQAGLRDLADRPGPLHLDARRQAAVRRTGDLRRRARPSVGLAAAAPLAVGPPLKRGGGHPAQGVFCPAG